jgi:uncharacterized membrane protein YkvI
MFGLASLIGVLGDILGIVILAIAVICIYFVSQLFIGHTGRSRWMDEEEERARAKDKHAA